jgi:hypothetical protein
MFRTNDLIYLTKAELETFRRETGLAWLTSPMTTAQYNAALEQGAQGWETAVDENGNVTPEAALFAFITREQKIDDPVGTDSPSSRSIRVRRMGAVTQEHAKDGA